MAFLIDTKLMADNIKFFRERTSYTVRQLAERALLPYRVVESMELGLRTPGTGQLEKVAHVLGVRIEDLVLPRPTDSEYFEGC